MTTFRPFELRDLLPTVLGAAFGSIYGAFGILCLWFVLFDFGWGILFLGLPLLVLQLAVIYAFDRYLKWRRRNAPPPPPTAWGRHHAMSLGAGIGATAAVLFMLAGYVIAGRAP